MAENSNGNGKSLRNVDTGEMVDELISRMDMEADDARKFKKEVMKACGYDVVPTYVKPTKKSQESAKRRGFFDRTSEDDDDWDNE